MITWIHPIVVHFVIGLLLLGTLFDVIGALRKSERFLFAGFCNVLAAAICAIVAVASGLLAEANLGAHSNIGNALLGFHKTFAIVVMLLTIALAGWRLAMRGGLHHKMRTIYLAIAFTACALLFFTGGIGGVLVYWYGLGLPPETARRVIEAQPRTVPQPTPAAVSKP